MSQHDPYGPSTGPIRVPVPPPSGQPVWEQPGWEQPGWEQPGWEQPGHDPYGYPPAGSPPPGYGYGYGVGPQRTNVMAILGLVFAFVCSPLGIVFSAIGLRQVAKRGEKGRGLALAGLILSIVFLLIGVLMIALVLPAATKAVDEANAVRASASKAAGASDLASGAGGATDGGAAVGSDDTGVGSACRTIVPALVNLQADMQDVHTPAQYGQAMARLEATLTSAASGASDQQFQLQIAQLNADLDKAAAAVQNGDDLSSLASALDADGGAVADACASAGVTD